MVSVCLVIFEAPKYTENSPGSQEPTVRSSAIPATIPVPISDFSGKSGRNQKVHRLRGTGPLYLRRRRRASRVGGASDRSVPIF